MCEVTQEITNILLRYRLCEPGYERPDDVASLILNVPNLKITTTEPAVAVLERMKLTATEMEVLRLLAKGHSNKSIARILNRSFRTIEVHRYNLRRKAGIKDKVQLMAFVKQLGL